MLTETPSAPFPAAAAADPSPDAELLSRWRAGDAAAFRTLVLRRLDWIEGRVRRRLGVALRGKGDTHDYVQSALVEVLRYGPGAEVESERHFRNLLQRIVENHLRDQSDRYAARRRAVDRERALPADSAVGLRRPRGGSEPSPSRVAMRNESGGRLRRALLELEPDDRRVIELREWQGLAFEDIGRRLGTTGEAARKRFGRALPRLLEKAVALGSAGAAD